MRRIALAAIKIYKRHLSPYKGFCCGYRTHLGRFSCSTLGFRAIRRFGVRKGIAVLRQRTALCAETSARYRNSRIEAQRGSAPCDLPCDVPCDFSCLPDCDLPDCRGVGRYFSCCDGCSCDWPERKKKNKPTRHVPPPRERIQRQ